MAVGLIEQDGNTQVIRAVETVPAANADFKVELPPGCYYIGVTIRSSVTGTTTTVGSLTPFIDKGQTLVGNVPFTLIQPNDAGAGTATLTLPAGLAGRYAAAIAAASSGAIGRPIFLPYGLRVSVVKGTAATGERLEVDITACRMDGVVPVVVS